MSATFILFRQENVFCLKVSEELESFMMEEGVSAGSIWETERSPPNPLRDSESELEVGQGYPLSKPDTFPGSFIASPN